ncbi:hypothetical protein M422DRAFT_254572 [Sphaerobolus stellatus SS14]|uniref:Uncharacterized protein n=1 Tax=Sphaerobolus stellatus (strain SS14) TaxID=990650 RepID=A0A0C9V5J8_SPHS4|nr:hypothetical protein M422DRAFT_254572 [Sphaerobolus stellatus SS14]
MSPPPATRRTPGIRATAHGVAPVQVLRMPPPAQSLRDLLETFDFLRRHAYTYYRRHSCRVTLHPPAHPPPARCTSWPSLHGDSPQRLDPFFDDDDELEMTSK